MSFVYETLRSPSTIEALIEWFAKYSSKLARVSFLWNALVVGIEAKAKFDEGKLTLNEVLQLITERFENKQHQPSAKFSPKLATCFAGILEFILFCRDCYYTKAYHGVIIKRVLAAICSTLIGHGIGFLFDRIKCFALGTVLGGWVLPILGTFVAGAAGDYLVKEIAGVSLEVLTSSLTFIKLLIKEKSQ